MQNIFFFLNENRGLTFCPLVNGEKHPEDFYGARTTHGHDILQHET